jgi:hypothetical protein
MKTPTSLAKLLEPKGALRRWGRIAVLALGFALVFGTYFTLADYYRQRGRMNADEGYYAVAARSVMEGKLPYRDFGYTQMPLLPYANGLLMSITGFGLDAQRRINVCWGALAMLTVIVALRRRLGRWEPGLVAAWCVALSPHYATFQAMGKTYAAAGFFLTACFAAVYWGGPIYRRTVAYAVFGALAAGSRLSLALPVGLAIVALLLECDTWKRRAVVVGITAVVPAVLLLPFVLAAREQFLFYAFEYHSASVFVRRSVDQFVELWRLSPAAILCCAAGLTGSFVLVRRKLYTELVLLIAAASSLVVAMIPESAYGEYAVPTMLIAGTTAIAAMWAAGVMPASPFRHVVWLLPLIALLTPLPRLVSDGAKGGDLGALVDAWVGAFTFAQTPKLSEEQRTAGAVEAAADFIRREVPPGEVLASIPIVAVDAGRPVVPHTEMGQFSAMGPDDEGRAARLNLTSLAELTRIVESGKPVAIVKLKGAANWNFQWQSPSLRPQPRDLYARFAQSIDARYTRAFSAGDIEVLTPKD